MRLLRLLTATLGLGGFGILAGGASCNPVSDFQCSTNEDCEGEGAGGICESNNFCTFPDAECSTGKRWHDRASSLAGMCFGDAAGTDTDVTPGSSSTGDPTTGSAETSTGAGVTTDPLTTGDPTTGDPMTSSTGTPTSGGSSTGGMPASCDDTYGAATDYMLCEETEEFCRFNVTAAMAATCTMICESFGGMCLGAEFNEAELCTPTDDSNCEDMSANDLICNCSR
jgi:hypothetical protein